jgi:hypothetical protein
MATALSGLLRSIANTMGPAVATVVWERRYTSHLQQLAENTPLEAVGLTTALGAWEDTLQHAGELAAELPAQALALLQDRLSAEAGTVAWQDYFGFNALLAIVCLVPALPCWRRTLAQPPATIPTASRAAPPATPRHDSATAPAAHPDRLV